MVDSHMHLFPTAAAGRAAVDGYPVTDFGPGAARAVSTADGTVADGVAALDAAGLTDAWLLSSFEAPGLPFPPDRTGFWPQPPAHAEHAHVLAADNEWLCAAAAAEPRLHAFVTAHPALLGGPEAAAEFGRLVDDHGAAGLKLHTVAMRTRPDDPGLAPVFAQCARRGLPVVVHTGPDRYGAGWSRPGAFAPVLGAHPDLKLVLAHLGGACWRELAPVAEAFPQARFDLSETIAWTGSPLGPTEAELTELIRAVGPERVLLGSDFPWYDPVDTVAQVRALGLSDSELDGILGANALALLA
jgi:predicted TIM-barrel fold metal-dependent hydrolase